MKHHHKPQYLINKTEKFIRKSQELKGRYNRVFELLQSIDWHLERKPHHFNNVAGDYYLLKTGQLSNPEFPQVNVVYMINEEHSTVILLDIEN